MMEPVRRSLAEGMAPLDLTGVESSALRQPDVGGTAPGPDGAARQVPPAAGSAGGVAGVGAGPADGGGDWPASMAFLTCWCKPATTAQRTRRVPLWRAWGVHFVTGLLAVVLICMLGAYSDRQDRGLFWLLGEVIEEFVENPDEAWAITGIFVVMIELSCVVLALILLAWGAGDEPVRHSIAHALRRVWLQCPQFLIGVAAFGVLLVPIMQAQQAYWSSSGSPNIVPWNPPTAPTPPSVSSTNSPEWQAYQDAVTQYQKDMAAYQQSYQNQWQQVYRNRPFLVRTGDVLLALWGIVLGLWWLWAFFRAAGVVRPLARIARPPMCEGCGYDLTGTPAGGRCPECGRPMADSLGEQVRTGCLWEEAQGTGWTDRLWAGVRVSVQALVRPRRLGEQLRATVPIRAGRGLLLGYACLLSLLTVLWLTSVLWMIGEFQRTMERGELLMVIAAILGGYGVFAGACLFALGCLAASLVGWLASWQSGRNLLPVAMQAGSYLGGYLLIWVIVGAIHGGWLVWLDQKHLLDEVAAAVFLDDELLIGFSLVGLHGLGLAGLMIWVHRITMGARYANK